MKEIYKYLSNICLLILLNASFALNGVAGEPSYILKIITPEMALKTALAVQDECRSQGFQVTVAVVNRAGQLQVLLRDRYAGEHTVEAAINKAWTAASFRQATAQIAESTQSNKESSGIRSVSKVLAVGGGVLIEAGGNLYGAVGVSGAPTGKQDDQCALKPLSKVNEELEIF